MPLNAQSPIPLYRQLAQRISTDIDTGVHVVASRIPSENELARTYGIGRPTVRQATDLLVRQGRLERRRGSGTFVLPPTKSIDLFSLAGTSAALMKSDLDSQLELISGPSKPGHFTEREKDLHTELPPELPQRIKIERRALVENRPVLFETFWFAADVFAGLEKHSLKNQSLSALVRDVYFMEATAAEQSFSVVQASSLIANQLDTNKGVPVLRVFRRIHFGELKSALHAEILCLTDRFAFSQTLYPAHAEIETPFTEAAKSNAKQFV